MAGARFLLSRMAAAAGRAGAGERCPDEKGVVGRSGAGGGRSAAGRNRGLGAAVGRSGPLQMGEAASTRTGGSEVDSDVVQIEAPPDVCVIVI